MMETAMTHIIDRGTTLTRTATGKRHMSAGDRLLMHVLGEAAIAASYAGGHGYADGHSHGRTADFARMVAATRKRAAG